MRVATDFHGFMTALQRRLDLVVSVTKNADPTKADTTEEGDDITISSAQDSGLELLEID